MRVKETKVYNYGELNDRAKERARDWYREASAGDDIHEFIYDDAATIAELMGIDLRQRAVKLVGGGTRMEPAIYYKGFWSQGDGACFEGTWRAYDVKPGAVAKHAPQDIDLHAIAAVFEHVAVTYPHADMRVRHRGHYYHEHCTEIESEPGDCEESASSTISEQEWADAFPAGELAKAARDFMRWIYRTLEKEWEYQNSDEQVAENIEANEYEFTEDGRRAGGTG